MFQPNKKLWGLLDIRKRKLNRLRRYSRLTTVRPSIQASATIAASQVGMKGETPSTSKPGQETITATPGRISAAEMQAHCKKGLCFNCYERFTPGHRCKKIQICISSEKKRKFQQQRWNHPMMLRMRPFPLKSNLMHLRVSCMPRPRDCKER
ncbi:hypothetical protein MRB53_005589 [Persea americana]|uniref:Uncharacterized protein n=1 Tax=Persea americana TaxID=3435 RepID=A0ACC2MDF6_PERAE|nr:hypothetical protein MRB53_005589 [Persea americana]